MIKKKSFLHSSAWCVCVHIVVLIKQECDPLVNYKGILWVWYLFVTVCVRDMCVGKRFKISSSEVFVDLLKLYDNWKVNLEKKTDDMEIYFWYYVEFVFVICFITKRRYIKLNIFSKENYSYICIVRIRMFF